MEKTTKIDNDHADQQIQVSGSEISSKSEQNEEEEEEFQDRKQPVRQNLSNYNEGKQITLQGGYQPSEYANLPVSSEVKELFKSIQRYTPILAELDTKLKAFVPEYIPAIGEVDAFLKMPRPDQQPETLGLYVLDEPALNQSNKAKMDLQIAKINKVYTGNKSSVKIHSIKNAEKNPKEILNWINSVGEIHKKGQAPSVSYGKSMPDIDSLMQIWPEEVEQLFSDLSMPSEEIDLSLADYSKVACNILDIPVHSGSNNNLVESLHVLFTLFSAFKENQHFNMGESEYMEQR